MIPIAVESACGTCTLCCKLMLIKELEKPRNKWCSHCTPGKGCGIYKARPESCREWSCFWLQSQAQAYGEEAMPPELRPDRCHVILETTTDGKYPLLHVDQAYPDALEGKAVKALIRQQRAAGRDIFVWTGRRQEIIRALTGQRVLIADDAQ